MTTTTRTLSSLGLTLSLVEYGDGFARFARTFESDTLTLTAYTTAGATSWVAVITENATGLELGRSEAADPDRAAYFANNSAAAAVA